MDKSAVARASTSKRVLSVTPLACHRISYRHHFRHFAWASPREKTNKQTNNNNNAKQNKKHCELCNNSGFMYAVAEQRTLMV